MTGRVLTVAESDSCGASGVQADIKTILALGGYATTAVTAVTAQSTRGIGSTQLVSPDMVAAQMRTVMDDIGAGAVKTGGLMNEATVNAVGDVLDEWQTRDIPVIVDPSIIARDGSHFLDLPAIAAVKRRLFVRTHVLTPNLKEAELLTGMTIRDLDDMRRATDMMRTLGVETVVLKAGQALNEKVLYLVACADEERIYERPMLNTPYTLGAGCTLASAIAVSLAQDMNIFTAIERALDFIHQAILHAHDYGTGAGPMNHAFDIEKASSFFKPENVKIRELK